MGIRELVAGHLRDTAARLGTAAEEGSGGEDTRAAAVFLAGAAAWVAALDERDIRLARLRDIGGDDWFGIGHFDSPDGAGRDLAELEAVGSFGDDVSSWFDRYVEDAAREQERLLGDSGWWDESWEAAENDGWDVVGSAGDVVGGGPGRASNQPHAA